MLAVRIAGRLVLVGRVVVGLLVFNGRAISRRRAAVGFIREFRAGWSGATRYEW
jgi:hypothetical protein